MTNPPHTESTSAAAWLRGRRLLHLDADEANTLDLPGTEQNAHHSAHLDGIIICGARAVTAADDLRLRRPGLVVLVEPHVFATADATVESPFVLADDGLFDYTLESAVDDQLMNGAPFAIAPTGYVRSHSPEALKKIVNKPTRSKPTG